MNSRFSFNFKKTGKNLQSDIFLLYYAFRDHRTPWYAKLSALLVVLYAVSPIDLIPDFIPVIGHLDDMIIIPFGMYISFKLIPAEIVEEHRKRSEAAVIKLGKYKTIFIIFIVASWILFLAGFVLILSHVFKKI